MPAIYRAMCLSCGGTPDAKGGVAGWVTTDGRKGGKILSESFLALKLDSGEFVCLPHPIESSRLKGYGFTWVQASRQSRLFHVKLIICEGCGLICEEYQHHDSRTGCLLAFLTAPAMILFLKCTIKLGWLTSIFGAWFGMFAVLWGVGMFNRMRWRWRNAALKLRNCSACGGTKFISVSRAAGKSLMCPQCHTPNMRYDAAGIS
jgi:hypothetical protein